MTRSKLIQKPKTAESNTTPQRHFTDRKYCAPVPREIEEMAKRAMIDYLKQWWFENSNESQREAAEYRDATIEGAYHFIESYARKVAKNGKAVLPDKVAYKLCDIFMTCLTDGDVYATKEEIEADIKAREESIREEEEMQAERQREIEEAEKAEEEKIAAMTDEEREAYEKELADRKAKEEEEEAKRKAEAEERAKAEAERRLKQAEIERRKEFRRKMEEAQMELF